MAYFKINGTDYSHIVNSLKVNQNVNYNAQTNAAGNTVVDLINVKKTIEVGIIPLSDTTMTQLLTELDHFNMPISFRNPKTNALESINCIVPKEEIEYYTIQVGKVLYNGMTVTFIEL